MCITHSVLSCNVATSSSSFSVFILSEKNDRHYERYINFQNNEHQPQENILHHYLHFSFLRTFENTITGL